jgi:hypothetical protein
MTGVIVGYNLARELVEDVKVWCCGERQSAGP